VYGKTYQQRPFGKTVAFALLRLRAWLAVILTSRRHDHRLGVAGILRTLCAAITLAKRTLTYHWRIVVSPLAGRKWVYPCVARIFAPPRATTRHAAVALRWIRVLLRLIALCLIRLWLICLSLILLRLIRVGLSLIWLRL
jgi:hypothetical protein